MKSVYFFLITACFITTSYGMEQQDEDRRKEEFRRNWEAAFPDWYGVFNDYELEDEPEQLEEQAPTLRRSTRVRKPGPLHVCYTCHCQKNIARGFKKDN